jgi:hypothetical protein
LESVWIADGDGELAHAQLVRIAQPRRLEIRCINPDDGQIRLRIRANDSRLRVPAISQRHFNPVRAVNHVAVGESEAVRRDDETRPATASLAPRAPCLAFTHINLHHPTG